MKKVIKEEMIWQPSDGEALKSKRLACHLSTRDVEDLTGIGHGTVLRYENGPCTYADPDKWNTLDHFYTQMIFAIACINNGAKFDEFFKDLDGKVNARSGIYSYEIAEMYQKYSIPEGLI